MAKDEKLKTSIYLPRDLHWKFKEEVVKRRFASDTAAMEAAIREWLERRPVEVAAASASQSRWHKMLAEILASGDAQATRAIQQNLRVLFRGVAGATELHMQRKPDGRKKQG